MKFEIDIQADEVLAKLQELSKNLDNLRRPLNQAGLYMERETKLNFARQSAPDGAPWATLSPRTWATKNTREILRETSDLMGGIASEGASGNEVRVSSSIAYGMYHQNGTSRMPARPFMGIEARHEPRIRKIFEDYLESILG